jgi:endonuclease/exonuclease/phosphatase family metal-dependent hydrolase
MSRKELSFIIPTRRRIAVLIIRTLIALIAAGQVSARLPAQEAASTARDEDFVRISRLLDPIFPAKTWQELALQHRWLGPAPLSEDDASAQIRSRHGSQHKRELRLLAYNTYLLDGLRLRSAHQTLGMAIGAKPLLEQRAKEIGEVTSTHYDAAVLSEVFGSREKRLLHAGWKAAAAESGPNRDKNSLASSGLYTLSKLPIRRAKTHVFRSRGDRLVDPDAWANKGVLMTEISFGFPDSGLEIYSTHLFAGGPLPPDDVAKAGSELADILKRASAKIPWLQSPARTVRRLSDMTSSESLTKEKHAVRTRQVEELIEFYRQVHDPRNVAIVAGDFNIHADCDGKPTKQYRQLVRAMSTVGLYDLWADRCRTRGPTSNLLHDALSICRESVGQTTICDERSDTKSGNRIDYLFVERPMPEHGFNLDLTRPLRNAFRRDKSAKGYEEMQYLSDHIGLSVVLIATPIAR